MQVHYLYVVPRAGARQMSLTLSADRIVGHRRRAAGATMDARRRRHDARARVTPRDDLDRPIFKPASSGAGPLLYFYGRVVDRSLFAATRSRTASVASAFE